MKYSCNNTTFNGVRVNDTIDEFRRDKYTSEDYKGYFARLVAVGDRPVGADKIGASNQDCKAAIALFSEHEPYRAIYAMELPEKYGEYEGEDGSKTAKWNKPSMEFWNEVSNQHTMIHQNNPFIIDAKVGVDMDDKKVTYKGPVAVTSRWNISDDIKMCMSGKDAADDVVFKHQNSLILTCLEDNGMFNKGDVIQPAPGEFCDISVNKVYAGNDKATRPYMDFVGDTVAKMYDNQQTIMRNSRTRYEQFLERNRDLGRAGRETLHNEILNNGSADKGTDKGSRIASCAYAKVTMRDTFDEIASPYYKGYIAVVDEPGYRDGDYDEYYRLKNLHTELADHRLTMGGRDYVDGDWMSAYESNLFVDEVITKDHPDFKKCQAWEKQFDDMHVQAPYEIRGVVYDVAPTYYDWDKDHIHPNYECIEEKTWNPKDVHSLEDCEKWILKNHPDYYMGYSAQQKCPSGAFSCGAIPSAYGREYCETYDARRKYAAERAKNLGVSLGPVEHDKDGKLIAPSSRRRLPDVPNAGVDNDKQYGEE